MHSTPFIRPFLTGCSITKDHAVIYKFTQTQHDPFSRSTEQFISYSIMDDQGNLQFLFSEPFGFSFLDEKEFYPTDNEPKLFASNPAMSERLRKLKAKLAAISST